MNSDDEYRKKRKRTIAITMSGLGVFLIIVLILALNANKGKPERDEEKKTSNTEKASVTEEVYKADKYYKERATVVSVTDLADDDKLLSGQEAVKEMEKRGFKQAPLTSNVSAHGSFTDETEIDSSSGEKHPVYQTSYTTKTGEVWIIKIIENAVFASPLSYNYNAENQANVILSESDEMIGYDYIDNRLYRIIPNKSAQILLKMDRIDADLLEGMTSEVIDSYVK